jgi:hypothetical protein
MVFANEKSFLAIVFEKCEGTNSPFVDRHCIYICHFVCVFKHPILGLKFNDNDALNKLKIVEQLHQPHFKNIYYRICFY